MTGIDPNHLRRYVIAPTLQHLAQWNPKIDSEAATRLLLMTAAHESRMGTFLHQNGGPALGIYQMEPLTADDLMGWISRDPLLRSFVAMIRSTGFPLRVEDELPGNLYFATALARLHYWRRPEPMPHEDDIHELAIYAKIFYNSKLGKATVGDYEDAYHDLRLA